MSANRVSSTEPVIRSSSTMCGIRGNREVAESRTAGIFIRDTACFHCDSMNCDSKFIESQ